MEWYDLLRINPAINKFMEWRDAEADNSAYQSDLAMLGKDPYYQPDLTRYTDPVRYGTAFEIKRKNLDSMMQMQAAPVIGKFLNDYRETTGTTDPRFMMDAENRTELEKAGMPLPKMDNPYVAKGVYDFIDRAPVYRRYGEELAPLADQQNLHTLEGIRNQPATEEGKRNAAYLSGLSMQLLRPSKITGNYDPAATNMEDLAAAAQDYPVDAGTLNQISDNMAQLMGKSYAKTPVSIPIPGSRGASEAVLPNLYGLEPFKVGMDRGVPPQQESTGTWQREVDDEGNVTYFNPKTRQEISRGKKGKASKKKETTADKLKALREQLGGGQSKKEEKPPLSQFWN